ncbi:hypothetical protein ACFWOS_33115 [Streptomyces rubiginosohelvolus]|uniref:hypothetical protein n=1 Tax=Streptomyces rubiginosohelvolus TaxID=67362 RepID=UPI0036611629
MMEILIALFAVAKIAGALVAGVRLLQRVTGWGVPKDGSHRFPCTGAWQRRDGRKLLLLGSLHFDTSGRARWVPRLRTPVELPAGGAVTGHRRLRLRRATVLTYLTPAGEEFRLRLSTRDARTAARLLAAPGTPSGDAAGP